MLGFKCRKAVQNYAKETIVLAAAGNNQGGSPTWPAWEANVLPVYSVDKYGKPSPFNAQLLQNKISIGAYGSAVEVDGREISRTSCAVAIAAAMVANILEFAQSELPDVAKALQSPKVMEKLLSSHLLVPSGYSALLVFKLNAEGFWDGRDSKEIADRLRTFIHSCPQAKSLLQERKDDYGMREFSI